MSGLKNTAKRMMSFSKGKGYTTGAERQAKAEGKEQARLDAIYASADLPDEEEVGREARRRQARRRGSRASTILTDSLG
jgi:hypothetical protein